MAFDGSTRCWRPNQAFQVDMTPRLQKAQYGDGYQQRVIDGINTLGRSWSLTFSEYDTVLQAMNQYLASAKGAAFIFLDPQSSELVQVFCDKWSIAWSLKKWTPAGKGPDSYYRTYIGSLTAQFDEAFGSMVTV